MVGAHQISVARGYALYDLSCRAADDDKLLGTPPKALLEKLAASNWRHRICIVEIRVQSKYCSSCVGMEAKFLVSGVECIPFYDCTDIF
jgi:hypothetical protein